MTEGVQQPDQTRSAEVAVDQGMRRWYESCPCCLSAAYPNVKRVLDLERSAVRERTDGQR
jgi:hypothetical protein